MLRKLQNVKLPFLITSSKKLYFYCILLVEMTIKNPQELPLCQVHIQPERDNEPPRKRLKSSSASQISLVHAARLSRTRDVNSRPSLLRVDNECDNKKSIDACFQRGPKKGQSSLEQPPKQSNLIQTYRSGNALRKAYQVSALLSVRSDPKALPPGRPLGTPPCLRRFSPGKHQENAFAPIATKTILYI
jgi:hypothetical protein